MPTFRWPFGPPVPEWARFFKPEAFRAFQAGVRAELARLDVAHTCDFTEGCVMVPDASESEPRKLGLVNLAQRCHLAPREEWPEILERHFERVVIRFPQAEALLESLGRDFAAACPFLKVQLYPDDTPVGAGDDILYWPLAPGLHEVAVLDVPEFVRSLGPNDAERWGQPAETLRRVGRENLRRSGAPQVDPVEIGGDLRLLALEDDMLSHFAAARVLFLEEYLGPLPEYGALVALPHGHLVLAYPIRDLGVMDAIEAMLSIAEEMHQEGPNSLSPHLYWWSEGRLIHLPAHATRDRIEFHPPDAFLQECLNRLPPPPG